MLDSICSPDDLKQLSIEELETLASEIREFLITNITKTGGHLASNLGVVELTIALHYVFDTPEDSLIWDVSHQAYVHKILTGRKEQMHTIRQKEGLSGFAKRSESEYDAFGAGHSSTSISAALGIACAHKLSGSAHHSVAIIGDGALTGGMAFEAINNLEGLDANVLIIVNDNEMSISKNVGGLSKHLTKLIAGKVYGTMKHTSMRLLDRLPALKRFAKRSEEHVKGMFLPSSFFESLGVEYFGPIDGHNLKDLITILKNMKDKTNPRVLHIATTKGSGLAEAEENPLAFHGISPLSSASKSISFSGVFGTWLVDHGKEEKLVAITPAMSVGSGMVEFAEQFPNKFFDTGITEQHAITFAAGLASKGYLPIVAIYSTFLQRGYDQFIHDVAIQHLPVIFAIDRAGIVGSDGATHNGSFDISYLLPIPDVVIATPSNGNELYALLTLAYTAERVFCIRYPRAQTSLDPVQSKTTLTLGKADIVRRGHTLAILVFGDRLPQALDAGEQLDATVVNMLFVKPLDTQMITELVATHEYIITIETNATIGGAGQQVVNLVNTIDNNVKIGVLAIPDMFHNHAGIEEIYAEIGLTSNGILDCYAQLRHEKDI